MKIGKMNIYFAIKILPLISCFIFPLLSMAENNANHEVVKIAIIDNLSNVEDRYTSSKYVEYYLNGIDLAVKKAASKNIVIEYKKFFYSNVESLKIFEVLPEVNKWNPDIIIGPRWSDQFLLLKNSFKNIMVISPFATAEEIYKMPENFYSISPPSNYSAKAILSLKNKLFPGDNIFILTQADCKGCVDLSEKIAAENNNNKNIKINFFLGKESESIDIEKTMIGYDKKSPIILAALGNSAGVLMARIANKFEIKNITFIGGDQWGGWKVWDVGKIKSRYEYQGFRISPWSTCIKNGAVDEFNQLYVMTYKEIPDNISYVGYQVINSIVDAIRLYPVEGKSSKEKALKSYQLALKNNPEWFRPSIFGVYHLDQKEEKFYTPLPIKLSDEI